MKPFDKEVLSYMPDEAGRLDKEGQKVVDSKKHLREKEKEDARAELIRRHGSTKPKKKRRVVEYDPRAPNKRV
jgi:hypothetical protein